MKKSGILIAILVIVAVVAIIFGVTTNNQKNTLQQELQSQLDAANAQNAALNAANAELTANNDALTANNAELTAANDALTAANAELTSNVEALNTANSELTASNGALNEDLTAVRQQADETSEALKAAEENAAALQEQLDAIIADPMQLVLEQAQQALEQAQQEAEQKGEEAKGLVRRVVDGVCDFFVGIFSSEEEDIAPEALVEEITETVSEEAAVVEEAVAAAVETVENAVETVLEEAAEQVDVAAEPNQSAAANEPDVPMDHAAFIAAELDSEVSIETYVQAKQSWWDNKATIYTQAEDGAYFIYNLPISQEEYDKLVPGTKIAVTGYKSEWSGEVEIIDATYEILEAEPFIAEAADVTDLLGKDELIDHQNQLVAFKGMTVEAYDETGAAFAYKDAVGKTDDLYFKASKDGATYDFCVEFYLCGQDTDVYKAVEALNVGDVIDLEGFLYWYNGANPHITAVKAAE